MIDTIPATMGERIKKLREKKGMTQKELATFLGTQREILSDWEANKGGRNINTDRIYKLAEHFSVTCDYLIRGVETENSNINYEFGYNNNAIETLKLAKNILDRNKANTLDEYLAELSQQNIKFNSRKEALFYANNTIDFINLFLLEPFPAVKPRALDCIMDLVKADEHTIATELIFDESSNLTAKTIIGGKHYIAQEALEELRISCTKK